MCLKCDPENEKVSDDKIDYGENALYVLIEDCGHIIEVKFLDKWIDTQMNNGHVKFK